MPVSVSKSQPVCTGKTIYYLYSLFCPTYKKYSVNKKQKNLNKNFTMRLGSQGKNYLTRKIVFLEI